MKKKTIIWLVIIVVAFIVIGRCAFGGAEEKLVFRTHVVSDYTIENTVTATGTVQPVEKVVVGTQVSGEIASIFVDFNSEVKKGQLIAELDKSNLLENLRQAEASVKSAESEEEFAKSSYERTKQLYEAKAATQISFDESYNVYVKAQTSLLNAKSNLDKAKVNLGYAEIYSPIDGVVLSREVEIGQTVAASYSTPSLFTIAKDLTQMKVEADVDEADIGQVKEGQKVRFTVDAFIDDTFYGEVEQIRLNPKTTSNVVTYTVIISAPNPSLKLLPGLTASVTIITEEQTGLALPAEALAFEPDQKVMQELKMNYPPENVEPQQKKVWVKSNGLLQQKAITTGMSDGVYYIVEEGVNEGDSVVLSANFVKIYEGRDTNGNIFRMGPPQREQGSKGNGRSQQKNNAAQNK